MSTTTTYDEKKLLIGLRSGSKDAFSELYDRFSGSLYGVCLKVVDDEAQAQDILQESFVKIWKKVNAFDENKGRLFTWMLNLTRNTAIDALRKNKRKATHKIQTLDYDVNIEKGHQTELKVDAIGMKEVVDKLPSDQKEVIDYLYFKGYTQKETSDELNLPLGTVKSRIRIAVRNLREALIK